MVDDFPHLNRYFSTTFRTTFEIEFIPVQKVAMYSRIIE